MIEVNGLPAAVGETSIMVFRIRPMQKGDLPAVVDIDRRSFSLPWPENAFQYELTQNTAALLRVAEIDLPDGGHQVIAAIVIWMILDEAHIATLAVHPEYRRRGIGRQLLAHALRDAIKLGASQAMLEVRVGNLAAQDLYRQFGFRITGRRPRYYQDNREDAILMTADLQNLFDPGA
jgi:ribosomal-protein-alanine N-acetyltransferase